MATRKKSIPRKKTAGAKRTARKRPAAKRGGPRLAPVGRKAPFDPHALFPFSGESDGDLYMLCSDGLVGEFAIAANKTCCRVWRRLANKPDATLGRDMVRMLTASGNDTCLDAEEKQLIRTWTPHQLRHAVNTVVNACEQYGMIDPHLTKFKTPPWMDPTIWIWTRPYRKGERYGPGSCGIYMVFLHPKFKLSLPGTCKGPPPDAF